MVGRPRSVSDAAIFAAVAEVVTAAGPSGLTLATVAQRVGLSAPALAQRFGSKRGLLLAFAANEAGNVESVFAPELAAGHGPVGALRRGLIAHIKPITSRKGMANNLAFLQLDLTDTELRSHAVAQSRALRAELAGLLRRAVDAGELVGVDAERLAEDLYTVYCGAQLTWAIDGRGKLTDWLGDRIDRVLAPYRYPPSVGDTRPVRKSAVTSKSRSRGSG